MPTRFEFDFNGTKRFKIKRCLGQGGMGVVYEVFDRETGSQLALKTLWRLDANALYRFKNEFRLLQDIDHPNLVRLGELVYEEGVWFFTMEYVDGIDFLAYVRPWQLNRDMGEGGLPGSSPRRDSSESGRRSTDSARVPVQVCDMETCRIDPPSPSQDDSMPSGPLVALGIPEQIPVGFDEVRLRDALIQLAQSIAVLHRHKRIHRDIKPNNVLVTREGRVVLLDFGLVTNVGQISMASVSSVVGTAAYMAPEQARSRKVGPEADWYSFGLVLYEALLGKLPFQGTATEILMNKQFIEPKTPSTLCADVPEDLDRLCMDLLQIDPQKRPGEQKILQRLGADQDDPNVVQITATSRTAFATPFVGREKEMAWLQTAFEQTREGHQVTVFVQGRSGEGKSELVRRFTAKLQQEEPRAVVLTGCCYARESVPYNAFDGIADALSRHMMEMPRDEVSRLLPRRADLLPQLFPVLRRVEVIAREPRQDRSRMDPQELRTRMFTAFRDLLMVLADHCPLVLVIDDFQWANADSLTLLTELVHPPDAPPLLLLATERTDLMLEGRSRDVRSSGHLAINARYLWVDRLSPDAARQLVSLLLPRVRGDQKALVERIAEEAEGHPMFIQELVRHLETGGDEAPAAMRLDEALWARVSRLPDRAREVLEVIAVAGAPLAQETAALAAQQDFNEFLRWSALLRAAFLARTHGARGTDNIEPYHARVREAVLANMDPEHRRYLHGRLAIALEQAGAAITDPRVLVTHFMAAGDAERAAWHAAEAVERASKAMAFDLAAEMCQVALELGRLDEKERRELQIRRGEALVNAGRNAEAAEVFLAVADDPDPVLRLECERQAAEQFLFSGRVEQGLATMRGILRSMGTDLPKTPQRALLSLLWRRVRVRLRGFRFKEKAESQIAREDLMRADVYSTVASGLGLVDTVRAMDFQGRGLIEALGTGEADRIIRSIAREAVFLASQGTRSLERARKVYRHCCHIAERSKRAYHLAWMKAVDGMISYFEGRLHTAAELLAEAEIAFLQDTRGGVAWELNNVRLFRMWSEFHGGSFMKLRMLYDRYLRDATRRGDRLAATSIRRSACIVWLVLDSPQEARRELERATWTPPGQTFHLQHWWEVEARSMIALFEGTASKALEQYASQFEALNSSLLTRVQMVRCYARAVQGRLALAASIKASDPKPLLGLAAGLAGKLVRERISYARIWGLLLRAGVALRTDHSDRGQQLLRSVINLAASGDMPAYGAAARYCLGVMLKGGEGQAMVNQAAEWMSTAGIVAPERMLEVLAPGCCVQ